MEPSSEVNEVVNLSVSTQINTNPETKAAKCSWANTAPPAPPDFCWTDTADNRTFCLFNQFCRGARLFPFLFLTKYFSER